MRQRIWPPPTVIISYRLSKLTSWGGLADIPRSEYAPSREIFQIERLFSLLKDNALIQGPRQWFRWAMGRIPYLRLSPG